MYNKIETMLSKLLRSPLEFRSFVSRWMVFRPWGVVRSARPQLSHSVVTLWLCERLSASIARIKSVIFSYGIGGDIFLFILITY